MYKKIVRTRNVTVALNLTDSLNVTESNLSVNLSRVLHTIQVGGMADMTISDLIHINLHRWWDKKIVKKCNPARVCLLLLRLKFCVKHHSRN